MLHLLTPLPLQSDKFDHFYEGSEITYHKNGNNMVLSDNNCLYPKIFFGYCSEKEFGGGYSPNFVSEYD